MALYEEQDRIPVTVMRFDPASVMRLHLYKRERVPPIQ
jgi:ribosomal protein L3